MTHASPPATTSGGNTRQRTRIKLCGFTREADVDAAVDAGADAIGFVLYAKSPRAVSIERAAQLAQRLPAFVAPVLLFVNETPARIAQAMAAVPHATLQFHGDESAADCQRWQRPYLKAIRIPLSQAHAVDLPALQAEFASAQALLLDAHVDGYGGGGQAFDWAAFNWQHPALQTQRRVVLSGGLQVGNVAQGVACVRPYAVDVSSGIELERDGTGQKGIKDAAKIRAFVAAVHAANW
jgi:phosphoribosylanthranilate isomerase